MRQRAKNRQRMRRAAKQKQQRFTNVRRHAEYEQRELQRMRWPTLGRAVVPK